MKALFKPEFGEWQRVGGLLEESSNIETSTWAMNVENYGCLVRTHSDRTISLSTPGRRQLIPLPTEGLIHVPGVYVVDGVLAGQPKRVRKKKDDGLL